MTTSQSARELAQALLASGDNTFFETFSITVNEQETNEEVIVWVMRSRKTELRTLKQSLKSYTPQASGEVCPACGGTGKLR